VSRALLRTGAPAAARKSFLEDEAVRSPGRREVKEIVDLEAALAVRAGEIRINAGGEEYRDGAGRTWSPDRFHLGGEPRTSPFEILGTRDGPLFRTFREEDGWSGSLAYSVPLPPGKYTVALHFAETNQKGLKRRFHVFLEGERAFTDLNPAEAGFRTARIERAAVHVDDGVLDIVLMTSRWDRYFSPPALAAIEIAPK